MSSVAEFNTIAAGAVGTLLGLVLWLLKELAKARANAERSGGSANSSDALLTEMTRQRDRLEDDVRDWRKVAEEFQKEVREIEQSAIRREAAFREKVEECERKSAGQAREIQWQRDEIARLDRRITDLLRGGGNQQ